jgi:hypothetical protein
LPGAIYDQELVFEQKELGNEGTDAARLEQLGQDDDQVDEKDDALKKRMVAGRGIVRNYGQHNNSPATGSVLRFQHFGRFVVRGNLLS